MYWNRASCVGGREGKRPPSPTCDAADKLSTTASSQHSNGAGLKRCAGHEARAKGHLDIVVGGSVPSRGTIQA
jgi:hypothetical protein